MSPALSAGSLSTLALGHTWPLLRLHPKTRVSPPPSVASCGGAADEARRPRQRLVLLAEVKPRARPQGEGSRGADQLGSGGRTRRLTGDEQAASPSSRGLSPGCFRGGRPAANGLGSGCGVGRAPNWPGQQADSRPGLHGAGGDTGQAPLLKGGGSVRGGNTPEQNGSGWNGPQRVPTRERVQRQAAGTGALRSSERRPRCGAGGQSEQGSPGRVSQGRRGRS